MSSSQNGNGASRANKYEKLPGNRVVRCPHCGDEMKQKRMDRHLAVHHADALQLVDAQEATAVAS